MFISVIGTMSWDWERTKVGNPFPLSTMWSKSLSANDRSSEKVIPATIRKSASYTTNLTFNNN